jgi:hypothetical protein
VEPNLGGRDALAEQALHRQVDAFDSARQRRQRHDEIAAARVVGARAIERVEILKAEPEIVERVEDRILRGVVRVEPQEPDTENEQNAGRRERRK